MNFGMPHLDDGMVMGSDRLITEDFVGFAFQPARSRWHHAISHSLRMFLSRFILKAPSKNGP